MSASLNHGILKALGIPEPVYEHQFHPTRKWRFDAAWPERKLALEFDGGVWRAGGGTHQRPKRFLQDMEKFNEAALLGWRILRVPTHKPDGVYDLLERAFNG